MAGSLENRVRARRRAEFRSAILEAGQEVFSRAGFDATRMEDIARAAGVATGTLYNYFASKDEVFEALTSRSTDELLQRLAAIDENTVGVARLQALVRETFSTALAWGHLFSVDEFSGLIEAAVQDAVDRGELRDDVSPADLARALAGVCKAFVTERVRPLVDTAEIVLQVFLAGAAPR